MIVSKQEGRSQYQTTDGIRALSQQLTEGPYATPGAPLQGIDIKPRDDLLN